MTAFIHDFTVEARLQILSKHLFLLVLDTSSLKLLKCLMLFANKGNSSSRNKNLITPLFFQQ